MSDEHISDDELNQIAESELGVSDTDQPEPVEHEESSSGLEDLISQMEAEAAEPSEEEAAKAEEAAVSLSEENQRNAERVNRGVWSVLGKFYPVASAAMAEAYGEQDINGLPDRVKAGEKVWFDILEQHGGMPGFVDKALSNPYVQAGLYLGTTVGTVHASQQMMNAHIAAQAQQIQLEGGGADGEK